MAYTELIRGGYGAFVQGDVDGMLGFLDPDFELHEEPDLPDGRVWHGREGFRSYLSEAGARWSELSVALNEVVQLDDETVVVGGTIGGTGSFSGAGVEARFWHALEFREGRLARMRLFFDREQAFEAVGSAGDDVELVSRIFDGFARGDFAGAVEAYHPDVEWIENRSITGHGVYRGLAELREGFLEWLGAWDDYRCEPEEVFAAGDRVVVSVRGSGRGKLSGVEATDAFYMVFSFRDGQVTRIENHREREDALAAAQPGEGTPGASIESS